MVTVFSLCAVIGGTVLVCQFLMTLLGLSGDHDLVGDHGELDDAGDHDASSDGDDHHASSALFSVLTLRTVVAALAFFGLSGLAADAAHWPAQQTLAVALASGGAALFGVHHLMQWFHQLRSDGTVRLADAVGLDATVYLRIPGQRSGHGKIQVVLKQQTVELLAETSESEIPSGAIVRITEFSASDVVVVERIRSAVQADTSSARAMAASSP